MHLTRGRPKHGCLDSPEIVKADNLAAIVKSKSITKTCARWSSKIFHSTSTRPSDRVETRQTSQRTCTDDFSGIVQAVRPAKGAAGKRAEIQYVAIWRPKYRMIVSPAAEVASTSDLSRRVDSTGIRIRSTWKRCERRHPTRLSPVKRMLGPGAFPTETDHIMA